jgi:lipopolysaccharide transport system ATP-binding protein
LLLHQGNVLANDKAPSVINLYLNQTQRKIWKQQWDEAEHAPGNEFLRMKSVELIPGLPHPLAPIDTRTPLTIEFSFYNLVGRINLITRLALFSLAGECIFEVTHEPAVYDKGLLKGTCRIPGNFLNDGSYYFSIVFVKDTTQQLYYLEECLHFDVEDYRENTNWYGKWWGYVRPKFPFVLESCNT